MYDQRERFLIRYLHDFDPFTVAQASGAWIQTTDGQRLLDFTSGQMCSTIGHNHPRICSAVQRSLEEAIHLNSRMLSEPVLALAERLAGLLPSSLNKVLLINTGGEANEAALRIAKMYTGRFEVVGLTRAWHGLQAGVASLNLAAAGHAGYGPLMPGSLTLPAPYAYRCPIRHCNGTCDCSCLEAGFEMVEQQSVGALCAVIAEPVLSAGGVIVPPPDYFQRLRKLCDDHEMLLILDEAQTGFGRLGRRFGFELYGVEPDIVSFSKTLGGGMPLAATVTTSAIEEQCYRKGYNQSSSHAFDPLPAAAALAVIEVIEEELLVEQAQLRGEYLMTRLRELQKRHEPIGDVRGQGLLVGVELVEDRTTKQLATALAKTIKDECQRCGLSMTVYKNYFRMAPPLSISESEIDTAIAIFDDVLTRVLASRSSRSSR